jgi:hypothetical protein
MDYVCIYFHSARPNKECAASLPWHVLYDGRQSLLHPLDNRFAKQETPAGRHHPPGDADMDYFHSPPDVASPLRRVSMATVSSQFHG